LRLIIPCSTVFAIFIIAGKSGNFVFVALLPHASGVLPYRSLKSKLLSCQNLAMLIGSYQQKYRYTVQLYLSISDDVSDDEGK
jgi:hypothetical protein